MCKIENGLSAIVALADNLNRGRSREGLLSDLLYAHVRTIRYAIEDSKKVVTPAVKVNDWPTPSLEVNGNEEFLARYKGKIAGIKAYRDRTRVGLKEAKDTIEFYMSRNHFAFGPAQSPAAEAFRTY